MFTCPWDKDELESKNLFWVKFTKKCICDKVFKETKKGFPDYCDKLLKLHNDDNKRNTFFFWLGKYELWEL